MDEDDQAKKSKIVSSPGMARCTRPHGSRVRPPADRSLLSRCRNSARARFSFLRPVRQRPVRPNEVTGAAVRIFLQIILMLELGRPERSGGGPLRATLVRPKARSTGIRGSVSRDPSILL